MVLFSACFSSECMTPWEAGAHSLYCTSYLGKVMITTSLHGPIRDRSPISGGNTTSAQTSDRSPACFQKDRSPAESGARHYRSEVHFPDLPQMLGFYKVCALCTGVGVGLPGTKRFVLILWLGVENTHTRSCYSFGVPLTLDFVHRGSWLT